MDYVVSLLLGLEIMKLNYDYIGLIQDHFPIDNIDYVHLFGLLLDCYLGRHPFGATKHYL